MLPKLCLRLTTGILVSSQTDMRERERIYASSRCLMREDVLPKRCLMSVDIRIRMCFMRQRFGSTSGCGSEAHPDPDVHPKRCLMSVDVPKLPHVKLPKHSTSR